MRTFTKLVLASSLLFHISFFGCGDGSCFDSIKIQAPISNINAKTSTLGNIKPSVEFTYRCCPTKNDKERANRLKQQIEKAFQILQDKYTSGTVTDKDYENYNKLIQSLQPTLDAVLQCKTKNQSKEMPSR